MERKDPESSSVPSPVKIEKSNDKELIRALL